MTTNPDSTRTDASGWPPSRGRGRRFPLRRDPFTPLTTVEWTLLALLGVLMIAFGGVTLMRSAYMERRMTDAGVYFRAGWALRVGLDPYAVRDNNWWTYLYPPPLAIVAMPLADPPDARHQVAADAIARQAAQHEAQHVSREGEVAPEITAEGLATIRRGFLPYPVSVVIWYAFGVACLLASCHWIALALERASADPRVRALTPAQRRWWVDRTLPLLVCLPAIGSTLSRGQVNIIMLAAIGAMGLALVPRSRPHNGEGDGATVGPRPIVAGVWLAVAACVKLFPGYLVVHALATGRWRIALGALVGTVGLLVVLPAVVLGPERAAEVNRSFVHAMLLPQLGVESDAPVDKVAELQSADGNQSFMAILHATRNLARVVTENRIAPSSTEESAHLALAAIITLVSAAAIARAHQRARRRAHDVDLAIARVDLLSLGVLATAMLPISPVCHNHYFALHMPLIAALIARQLDSPPRTGAVRHVDLDPLSWTLIGVYIAASIVPRLPWLEVLRPLGVGMYAGVALWALGIVALVRDGREPR